MVSIRDILSWVTFINTTSNSQVPETETKQLSLDPAVTYIHGACLVFLDAVGTGRYDSC